MLLEDPDVVIIPMAVEPDFIADHKIIEDTSRQLEVSANSYNLEYIKRKLIKVNLYMGGTYYVVLLFTTFSSIIPKTWILSQMILFEVGNIYFDITIVVCRNFDVTQVGYFVFEYLIWRNWNFDGGIIS